MGSKPKPDYGVFVGIAGVVLAILVPVAQANGVDVNWWVSALIYAVLIAATVWAYLHYAAPDPRWRWKRIFGSLGIAAMIGALGAYATFKQYGRDHEENLRLVRIVDVIPLPETPNSVYTFHVEVENTSNVDLRAALMCIVGKPNVPIKPFGVLMNDEDTTVEREFEDQIFYGMDAKDGTRPESKMLDLPAATTEHGYCISSWIPTQEELDRLHRGEFTLYVAGRVIVPGKSEGAHIDVDFCRAGSEKFGLQNCFGHNVPHVHKVP